MKICLILVLAIVGTKVSGSRYSHGYYRNGAPLANNTEPAPAAPTDDGYRGYYRSGYYRNGAPPANNPEPSPAALTSPTDDGYRGYYRSGYYRNGAPPANNTEPAPAPAAPTDGGYRGYYRNGASPPKEDDPRGKTHLDFLHESSSLSEEKPQEGLNHCHRCIYQLGCIPPYCHRIGCCGKEGAENSTSVKPSETKETSQESGGGRRCRPGCHWDWGCKCCKCHKAREEQTNPNGSQEGGNWWCCKHHLSCCHDKQESESSPSVSALVKAGLEQLKAGNTLKFNINIKNPQAIIDEAEALKGNPSGTQQDNQDRQDYFNPWG